MPAGEPPRAWYGRAVVRAATLSACAALPVLLFVGLFRIGVTDISLAWDFHHELYPQAQTMLDGRNPYPSDGFDPATGSNLVWPPLAVLLVAPLTALDPATADVVMALLGLLCFALALWIVGVRDWRVYGVVALWPPVFIEIGLSHLTPLLALLLALVWTTRESRWKPGLVAGIAVGVKLFLWPLGIWLAATGRRRALVVSGLVAAASLGLVLPFTSLTSYGRALSDVRRTYDQDAYTVFGLLSQAGLPESVGHAATVALVAALAVATWRYRSFTLAVATVLVASPIVWLDYYALAAIPLAIVRPRLSPVWFVPLATVGLEGAGLEIGDLAGSARLLAAFALVFAVSFRAERESATGRAHAAQRVAWSRRPRGVA